MNITVLGPQRQTGTARAAVADLIPPGPVATINAGWREREDETAELDDVLGGRMRNLQLWRRWRQLQDDDPDYAAAERGLLRALAEQQLLYQLRLRHAVDALVAMDLHSELPAVQGPAQHDALACLRALDRWQLDRVAALRAAFFARVGIGERPSVARHRAEIASLVSDSAGFVVTGGHVGALLQCLHVFDLSSLFAPPLVVWSAGAMALAERVILFNDDTVSGEQPAEVYAEGLGVIRGHVAFPHPTRRLHLQDRPRMARMAARFAPRRCLLLEAGARVDLVDPPAPDHAETVAVGDASILDEDGARVPLGAGDG